MMRVRHADKTLEQLEIDIKFRGRYSDAVVKSFRRKMALIRAAGNENDLRAFKSLHFEKLKGARSHQFSIRLNDQFRLILEIENDVEGNLVVIISIEDYH